MYKNTHNVREKVALSAHAVSIASDYMDPVTLLFGVFTTSSICTQIKINNVFQLKKVLTR